MEILDLYDNNFNKLDKTIIRRVDEIPNNTNIMLSYAIIKNDNKYLLEQTTARNEYKWCFAGGHLQPCKKITYRHGSTPRDLPDRDGSRKGQCGSGQYPHTVRKQIQRFCDGSR